MPVPVVATGPDAVSVRNTMGGHLVLTPDLAKGDYIEWRGAGDPTGADVQLVSPKVVRSPNFQKMLNRGALQIIDDEEEIRLADQRQQDEWERRQRSGDEAAMDSLDRKANNDSVVLSCVGPGPRGGTSECGENVVVKEKDKNLRPPLCTQHEHLATHYVPTEMQDGGQTRTSWVKVIMGEREYGAR